MQNVDIRVVCGSYGSLIRYYSAYGFIRLYYRNHASIFYRFRVIPSYFSKIADFSLPHLRLW